MRIEIQDLFDTLVRKALALVFALILATACDPKAGGGKPPAAAGAGGDSRGYTLRLDALSKGGDPVARKAECTIIGYAGGGVVVTVDGEPYEKHYTVTIGGNGYKLRILDFANVVTIEFICTLTGRPGDEFLCTVTKLSGGPAAFIGEPQDRDIIASDDNVALCQGTINARS